MTMNEPDWRPTTQRPRYTFPALQPRLPMVTNVTDLTKVIIPAGESMTFEMIRNGDESGVSGTGKVLSGVIFADGTTVVRWETVDAAQSTVVYDNDGTLRGFEKFIQIHVRSHPSNNVVIKCFTRDGDVQVWTQPPAAFDINKEEANKAARYITWAIQQPWFEWPSGKVD